MDSILLTAAIVGLKKGAISSMVRKQAFLQIGSRSRAAVPQYPNNSGGGGSGAAIHHPQMSNWNPYASTYCRHMR